MSHVTGEPVASIEYAMHHLAFRAGRFPWELAAMDPPADVVLHTLAIDAADAKGRKRAADLAKFRQRVRSGGRG